MRTATTTVGALAALALLLPAGVQPLNAPHDVSQGVNCRSCHAIHAAPGTSLTTQPTVADLCASCHNQAGVGTELRFPWTSDDMAVGGAGGVHHRWDASASNAGLGAEPPLHPEMAKRLTVDGKLQCTVCHDAHSAHVANGGSQHVSVHVGEPLTHETGAGTGTMEVEPPAPAANPRGYVVQLSAAGPVGTSTFKVSNDGGTSFFSWSGSAWMAAPGAGRPTGVNVALNDGENLKVSFAGTFAVGDRWSFYVSYPMLRVANTASEMCEDCHRSRVQSRLDVEGEPGGLLPAVVLGTTVFSHPAGDGVTFSGSRTCRTAILDGNGLPQGADVDGEPTNDLVLDAGGQVRCSTCHAPHNADSNGVTEDHR